MDRLINREVNYILSELSGGKTMERKELVRQVLLELPTTEVAIETFIDAQIRARAIVTYGSAGTRMRLKDKV